ncbi:MAG: hypothetical protein WC659_07035 [Patescibacteria group bacterium]|jgi:hypothetical protein
MYEHSRDILNLTLSACAALLTLLLAWLLVYCIRVMKTLVNLSRRIDETIRLAEETLTTLRDRAHDLASILPLIMKAVDKLVTYVGDKRKAKRSQTTINAKDQSSNVK